MNSKRDLEKIKKINCFLLDMDGTIYLGNKSLPGATKFIKKIKSLNKKTVYLSNNSSKNSSQYIKKLKQLKFEVHKDDIFTSLTATIIYLQNHNIKSVYPLGTPGFEKELL
jgi:NagD protein